jgi:Ser/Thr protein kinase RdoA (MazF antagonist)
MRGADGATALRLGEFVYEVHQCATGGDIYRDAVSWSPFSSLGHARSAGRALALFHEAARGFARPARSPGVLVSSACLVSAADPRAELGRLVASRPGLRHALAGHNLERDFELHCLPATSKAAPLLRALESQWGHGDWHASNLTWSSAGPGAAVAGVLDLGLANRTFAVHDLAVALERNTVDWLDLAGAGRVSADLDAVDALLEGYGEVRPLSGLEAAALVEVLPVVHCEHALAEVEYFAEVVGSTVNRDLAYDGYLIGHARWFQGAEGSELLDHLRSRFGPAFAGHASTARVSDPDALATVKEG